MLNRPPDGRRLLGNRGERLAEHFLEQHGYRIVARNVRLRGGELDLIARVGSCLVAVEVRLRRAAGADIALESITPAKQRRLRRLVMEYCLTLDEQPAELRIDVVAVALSRAGELREIVVIENAVEDV